jgi:hypothetical protein
VEEALMQAYEEGHKIFAAFLAPLGHHFTTHIARFAVFDDA